MNGLECALEVVLWLAQKQKIYWTKVLALIKEHHWVGAGYNSFGIRVDCLRRPPQHFICGSVLLRSWWLCHHGFIASDGSQPAKMDGPLVAGSESVDSPRHVPNMCAFCIVPFVQIRCWTMALTVPQPRGCFGCVGQEGGVANILSWYWKWTWGATSYSCLEISLVANRVISWILFLNCASSLMR